MADEQEEGANGRRQSKAKPIPRKSGRGSDATLQPIGNAP